ncbi:MAG: AAA family ATPase [Candidatus Poribacteria bacterium]|nr:AAA family ATPase [Candidatus Poribacteria bacterium]
MKITNIEIKNFRAFPKTYEINLSKTGKNLLVYGENGSGKSSLYLALKYFLESSKDSNDESNKRNDFESHQNIFSEDPGHIILSLRADQWSKKDTYEWSQGVKGETNNELITEASKSNGFLDYKALLETHYLHHKNDTVNLFDLLVKTLMASTVSPLTDRTLADDWDEIQKPYPRKNAKNQIDNLEKRIENFNRELTNRLTELRPTTSDILRKFGYNIDIDFDFQGVTYNRNDKTLDNQQILLKVEFFDTQIPAHHQFLNEAKLSAISIAIYLSSTWIQPESKLKILVLDDVLIGLDMSNRFPVLDILEDYFNDYQIFLTTYDKAWYEIVKQRTDQKYWKYTEFYFKATDKYEIPVCSEDRPYLEKSKEYLNDNDYKSSVIYLRTAFEEIIKRFCEKQKLSVRYCENPKKLTTEDFWQPIKTGKKKDGSPFLENLTINKIEQYRTCVLNPLSHAIIVNVYRREIEEAIKAVEELESSLL